MKQADLDEGRRGDGLTTAERTELVGLRRALSVAGPRGDPRAHRCPPRSGRRPPETIHASGQLASCEPAPVAHDPERTETRAAPIEPGGGCCASASCGPVVVRLASEEFDDGVVALYDRLVRVTYGVCWDRSLAEECAQEALVEAWARLERGEELRSVEAWTVRVALNRCRSQLRRRSSERRALGRLVAMGGHRAAGDARAVGLAADVEAAVRALPLRQREAVVLHYLCDMEVARVAEVTGRSTGAVKNALFHARASLARRLGTDEAEGARRG